MIFGLAMVTAGHAGGGEGWAVILGCRQDGFPDHGSCTADFAAQQADGTDVVVSMLFSSWNEDANPDTWRFDRIEGDEVTTVWQGLVETPTAWGDVPWESVVPTTSSCAGGGPRGDAPDEGASTFAQFAVVDLAVPPGEFVYGAYQFGMQGLEQVWHETLSEPVTVVAEPEDDESRGCSTVPVTGGAGLIGLGLVRARRRR